LRVIIAALALASGIFAQVISNDGNCSVLISWGLATSTVVETVNVGATVTWVLNQDNMAHTVSSDVISGVQEFESGTLTSQQTFSYTFNTPGTFHYVCKFHAFMTGVVVVQDEEPACPLATTAPVTTVETTTVENPTTATVTVTENTLPSTTLLVIHELDLSFPGDVDTLNKADKSILIDSLTNSLVANGVPRNAIRNITLTSGSIIAHIFSTDTSSLRVAAVAAQNGLITAIVNGEVVTAIVPTPAPSRRVSESYLSGGAIAGIVLGAIGFLVFFLVLPLILLLLMRDDGKFYEVAEYERSSDFKDAERQQRRHHGAPIAVPIPAPL